ncbi:acetolactate synthase large subunit [Terricaulis sp.]|uniref:acetolactate synthase large subunit n=1 Tax=Terricaulis sp. TaxID=2768686 RepID=UPI003783B87D
MKSAQRLLEYASSRGLNACFANPGTSEMHLVAALDAAPGIRPILAIFEGVATGAADGYGRIARTPALTLLHLGPGLGNGLANLHNAKRARTPIVSLIGDHATYHLANDPPLASDIVSIARPVSCWLRTVGRAEDLVAAGADAIDAAMAQGPAALILPADVAWSDGEPTPAANKRTQEDAPSWRGKVDDAARSLGAGAVLLLGGRYLSPRACAAAEAIAQKTGAKAIVETFPARIARGRGRAALSRLPYLSEVAAGTLSGVNAIVLAGAATPVAFFALPGRPTRLAPDDAQILPFATPTDDLDAALEALAEAVGARISQAQSAGDAPSAPDAGDAIDPVALARAVAATLPENAIVSDESNTLGLFTFDVCAGAAAHDWLTLTGGSIGQGLPVATGAAVAAPERRVVALQADGSALYTIQSLWTQAREGLNVTNVILNNGAYAILKLEMMRAGINAQTQAASDLFDLRRPTIDFVQVAAGFGVPGQRVNTQRDLTQALRRSFAQPGPSLIEVMFP